MVAIVDACMERLPVLDRHQKPANGITPFLSHYRFSFVAVIVLEL
jgi:hypothetical protein